MAQRVYKKDFTLRDLAEIQNREALGPGNPTDSYSIDPLDQPMAILVGDTAYIIAGQLWDPEGHNQDPD